MPDTAETASTAAAPEPKTYRPFLDVILKVAGNPPLPAGYDTWGFKITRPDLRTYDRAYGRFRWPWPGGTVTDENTVINGRACPTWATGGFCIALDLEGAASGGYGHATVLLLAYRISDVAGEDAHKRRVSHCLVAEVIAGQDAYRAASGADLRRADLQRADLQGADLQGADLRDAYLQRADLRGAHLQGADLRGAHLRDADLRDAGLRDAYLQRADLRGAHLQGADLQGAGLRDAGLRDADLQGADLQGADLQRADLQGADLQGADLRDAGLQGAGLRKDQIADAQIKQFHGKPSWLS